MAISVYEKNQPLHGFDHLFDEPVRLEYLPTKRSRKWRSASLYVPVYGQRHQNEFEQLAQDNGWYSWRVVACGVQPEFQVFKSTGFSSQRFGPCEVCNKKTSEVWTFHRLSKGHPPSQLRSRVTYGCHACLSDLIAKEGFPKP